MRLRNVDSYTDPATEITYGLRGDPTDFALSQRYSHDHVAAVTRALLTAGLVSAEVSGFGYVLAGGLSVSVAAGQAFDGDGRFFETITDPEGQPAIVTLDPADATHPRIDLVYVLLEPSVQAEALPRTFRRLRTPSELAANVDPYTPTNITRFAEDHARATVHVHKGTPAAVPAVPALNANEVALYQVRVNANAATLVAGNVTDVRQQARSLYQLSLDVAALAANLNESIDDRVATLINDSASVVKAYDDAAGTLTLSVPAEYVQDVVGAILTAAPNTGISVAYNDVANTLTISGVAATAAVMGMMSAADFSKLAASTSAATANAIAQRDANGDASFRRLTSTIATGTSPLAVTSQTEVANLNANYVQGLNLTGLDNRFINATGDDAMGGKLTSYNGLALAGFGLPAIVARYSNGNVASNIASTLLVAGAGDYLVLVKTYTTAANGSVAVSLSFTDPSTNAYNPQVTNHALAGGVMGQASMFITTNAAGVSFSAAYVGPGSYGIRVIVLRLN